MSTVAEKNSSERQSRSNAATRRDLIGYAFLTPWLIGFFCFSLGPVLVSLYLSFTKFDLLSPAVWVGTDNYARMFLDDPRFYQSLKVTFTYMTFEVPLKLAFALAVAMVLDKAIRAIGALEEDEFFNPIAARMTAEALVLQNSGISEADARQMAGYRIFGSKPGAYGAGLQALIDEKIWTARSDLAAAYVTWGAFAYGAREAGVQDEAQFTQRLKNIEAVVHNQDNREHDVLDSDDYYQFEGGMSAAVEAASGTQPRIYHNDHSRPERPVVRTLEEEVGRVMRSRVVNPKWITGVKRHGYKGAFEIAATVDYMFAFATTTGAVKTHHFDLAYDAFLADDDTREFIEANNPAALKEIAQRFEEAASRGLWTPRLNSAYDLLRDLQQ